MEHLKVGGVGHGHREPVRGSGDGQHQITPGHVFGDQGHRRRIDLFAAQIDHGQAKVEGGQGGQVRGQHHALFDQDAAQRKPLFPGGLLCAGDLFRSQDTGLGDHLAEGNRTGEAGPLFHGNGTSGRRCPI